MNVPPPTASLFGDGGGYGNPVGVRMNEDDDIDRDGGCGILGGTYAETDNGTVEKAGVSVPGDRVCMSNGFNAEAEQRI